MKKCNLKKVFLFLIIAIHFNTINANNYDLHLHNYVSSINNQMFLLGYNVGFPLIDKHFSINPCELYFGMVSKVGFYVKVKSNFNFKTAYKSALQFNSDFKDIEEIKFQRHAALLGVYLKVMDPAYLYFGIGYGYRKQLINAICLNENRESYTEKYYFNRYNSVELEAGLTVNIQMITVSCGAAMLPMGNKTPYFEISAGVGVALPAARF
ncbi:MAG: hypothetical protein PHC83_02915 [Bacteroidales bacterium]|jgi:hypothetical protein|nr:hypothetical protein [Bacteroidales bacterium]MDD4209105.1 hypothetical protein [Bacteroidales bacterium]MDY0015335.1 hypothetical protein [Bacteroidales bacterium]